MAVETATIRVTRATRDLLAAQARERGMSLSAMLEELAREAAREATFASEREAARADSSDRDARDDERVWESALGDGVV
jgi:antitoxin MazE7